MATSKTLPINRLKTSLMNLEKWVQDNNHSGWDPFDALNSPILYRLANNNHALQLFFIQLIKHLSVNLRNVLKIPSLQNSKGLAIFLSAYLKKQPILKDSAIEKNINALSIWLKQNHAEDSKYICWGYPFDWANRSFFVPKNHPNAVATSFVGLSLIEYYKLYKDESALQQARSACDFILLELNHTGSTDLGMSFSYTPYDDRYIHNVNMLAANFLTQTGLITKEDLLLKTASAIIKSVLSHQKTNGSWFYGEAKRDQFIDNFHTGFILVSLQKLAAHFPSLDIKPALKSGYAYWKNNFLLPGGIVRYYSNATYPIDTHAIAQSIITLLAFHKDDPQAGELACEIANWAITHMQSKQGYFYYQKTLFGNNRIPYMRWSQAWMYLALTELSIHLNNISDAKN